MASSSLLTRRQRLTVARQMPLFGLFISHAVSLGGNSLTGVAMPWFVLATTGSAAQTGLTAFVGSIPLLLGAFFGGALVDRLGYRRATLIADIASGLTVAAIPLLYATVGLAFWQLLALVFLGALLDVPGATARQALLPEAANRAGMSPERANAIYETLEAGALLGGPLLAGVLIAVVGAANVLWANALTFAISALLICLALPVTRQPAQAEAQGYAAALLDGMRFVLCDRLLRALVLLFTLVNLLLMPLLAVVIPVYIEQVYGDPLRLGLFIAMIGGGGILGALIYGSLGHRLPRRPLFIASFIGVSLAVAAIAALPPYPLLLAAALFGGIANGPINPIVNVVLQERTPVDMRGRVFGTITGLAMATTPLGVLGAGYALELLGLQTTLIIIATASLAVALMSPLLVRHNFEIADKPTSR